MSEAKIVLTAEDRTRAAFESAKKGLHGINEAAVAVGLSFTALGAAGSLAGLTAMVRGVANSLDAFNDLKDATGASIENISALDNVARRTGANFETVSTSLVKFNQALGQTVKPGTDAEKVIKAIGLNAQQLRDMDPAEALLQTATALSRFADDGNKARAVQELFGKSLKEVAPFLKDLAEAGQLHATVTAKQAEEAEKFNKQLFALQATMSDLGRTIASPVISHLNDLAEAFRKARAEGAGLAELLPLMQRATPAGMAAKMFSDALGLGSGGTDRAGASAGEVNRLRSARAFAQQRGLPTDDLDRQLAAATAQRNTAWAGQVTPADTADALSRRFGRSSIDLPADPDKGAIARAKAAADATLREAQRVAEERQKLRIKEDEEIAKFFQHQEELTLKAAEFARKVNAEAAEAQEKKVIALHEEIRATEWQVQTFGLSRESLHALTLARIEEQRELALMSAATLEQVEAVNKEYDARRKLAGLQDELSLKEVNAQAAKAAKDEWDRVADSFVDNLMRGGKSVAQYLKDLFRTLVLQPVLSPIVQSIGGSIGQALGGVVSGGGGAGGMLGNLASIGSLFGGGGLAGSVAAGAGWLTGATTFGGALGAAGSLIGTGTAGGIMSGIGMGLGALGPIGMGIGAIAMLAGAGKKGGPKIDSGAGFGVAQIGDPTASLAQIAAIQQAYGSLVAGTGGVNRGLQVGVFSSQDPRGTARTILDVDAGFGGSKFYDRQWRMGNVENVGRSEEELKAAMAEEVNRVLLGALQRSDVPGMLGEWLRSLGDAAKMSAKGVEEAIARLQKAGAEKQALDETWFQLTHTAEEQLARQRQKELAALDITNRVMAVRIYALQDEIAKQQQARAVYSDVQGELAQLRLTVGGYIDKLNATPSGMLPPEQQLANAQAQFAIQIAKAKSGDRNAMQGITGYADQLISAQVGYTASGTATADTIAYVKQALGGLPDMISAEMVVAGAVQDGTSLINASMQELIARADANAAAQIAAITAQAASENAASAAAAVGPAAAAPTGAPTRDQFSSGFGGTMRYTAALAAWRAANGVPGFADGGDYSGGYLHLVGERGPELRASGPARYWSAEQSAQMMRGGNDQQLRTEVQGLRQDVARLTAVVAAGARGTIDGIGAVASNTATSARAAQLRSAEAPA